jgi:hypothetical protein
MRALSGAGLVLLAFAPACFADQQITVTGCVATGVEAGCLVLRTPTGKAYNISSAKPRPVPGSYGTVEGTLKNGVITFCQQGEVINPAKWVMASQSCPARKAPR